MQNIHPKEMESRFRGFLMFKITQSKSEELSWKKEPKSDFFTSFCNSFPAAKVWYGRLISDFHDTRVFDDSSRVNLALCNYLQIQPKFAPPAAVIEYVDGKLHSLCLPKYRVYPRKEGYEHAIENITHPVPHLYSGAIDPVVAFRLQLRTVEYFSKASVKRGF